MIISARMHPTDHMSIALVYLCDPKTISGARYHRVAIYSVNTPESPWKLATDLASPKSAIFAVQFAFKSTLDGFKSSKRG